MNKAKKGEGLKNDTHIAFRTTREFRDAVETARLADRRSLAEFCRIALEEALERRKPTGKGK